jgi:hypothetical protein
LSLFQRCQGVDDNDNDDNDDENDVNDDDDNGDDDDVSEDEEASLDFYDSTGDDHAWRSVQRPPNREEHDGSHGGHQSNIIDDDEDVYDDDCFENTGNSESENEEEEKDYQGLFSSLDLPLHVAKALKKFKSHVLVAGQP